MKFNELIDILENEFTCAANACTYQEYTQIFGGDSHRSQATTYAVQVMGLSSLATSVDVCADEACRDIRSIVFYNIASKRLKDLEAVDSALEHLIVDHRLRLQKENAEVLIKARDSVEYQDLKEDVQWYFAITTEHEEEVNERLEALTYIHRT